MRTGQAQMEEDYMRERVPVSGKTVSGKRHLALQKILIILIPLLTGCHSFKPVPQRDNFLLYQEYLDKLYDLSVKEQEYDNLISSYLSHDPSYKPPIRGYKVIGERSGMGGFGFAKYELAPLYNYGLLDASALQKIRDDADRKTAEADIQRLKARISELESELSRRGLVP
ncbi:MAG: hypothetical protein H8D23_15060 [Candidatus Brocadiales bacterium]|nr:hypothetical protein [Candidatus Brocadiales bacterium]